jgi:transcriptional regulator with XRE-family HTH domain
LGTLFYCIAARKGLRLECLSQLTSKIFFAATGGRMSNRIKELRKARGLTQTQLAELAGKAQASLNRVEKGISPLTYDWAYRLAPHLGVQPHDIMESNEASSPTMANGVSPRTSVRSAFSVEAFLAAILAKAGSQAAIGRALDLPPSAVSLLFGGSRKLTMEEGMKLSEIFGIPAASKYSRKHVKPILAICLRNAPKTAWTDEAVERFAQDVEYGLNLLNGSSADAPRADVLHVVSQALAERRRD